MKCVPIEEGKEIVQEIHEGACDNHVLSRMLVRKAFRSGLGITGQQFWSTLKTSFVGVQIANSSVARPMFRHITSSPYHHPSLLLARVWT
jgi:hypothetical protein